MVYTKRRLALIAGLLGGVLYFLVDYGIFYMLLGTRSVEGASTFWLLLWLSMSYGFTNFVWIWLWLDRDGHTLGWSVLIVAGWLCTALLNKSYGAAFGEISISRGTSGYHGVMALLLFVGYAILIIKNIKHGANINLLWILSIGILVQFSWEAVLLVTGIRSIKTMPIIIDSLIETNMGLPYIYLIHKAVTRKRNEDLTLKEV